MIEWGVDSFIWRALLGGLGIALLAGPLGCFIVWQRMTYFGAALSHSAILGVVLGLVLGIHLTLGIILVCAAMAFIMVSFEDRSLNWGLPSDTLLGILAHAFLALGLVLLAFIEDVRFDLNAYLFGDILAISDRDLGWILGVACLVFLSLYRFWERLLRYTVSEEIALVEGVSVKKVRLVYMLLMALVVAVAIKIVGMLLITSLLIIPAAVSRRFAQTPEQMAVLSCLIGAVAVAAGIWASLQWDLPAGPGIVLAAMLLFILSHGFSKHKV